MKAFSPVPFLFAAGLSFLAGLVLARLAPRLGLMDDPNRARKTHSHPIPRVGGIAIWLAITVTILITRGPLSWPLWIGISCMSLVGLVDDKVELSALPKFLLQIAVGLFLWCFGLRITLFIPSHLVSLGLTLLWFVWTANAFNFMDNANGLCGGVSAIILAGIATIHLLSASHDFTGPSGWALIAAGAATGFLGLNFPRARVFLGDCGSHLLGAMIAGLMMQTTFVHTAKSQAVWGMLAAPFLVLVPAIDFAQVTIGRWKRGRPVWQGDTNHLSHLLMRAGFGPAQAVLILWSATALSVLVGIGICFWSR